MHLPKFHILLFIAIGLLVFSSISIAPNMGLKPVLAVDGTKVLKSDGSVLMEPDHRGYLKHNWFGFVSGMLSLLFFVLAIARLLWSGWLRLQRDRHLDRSEPLRP